MSTPNRGRGRGAGAGAGGGAGGGRSNGGGGGGGGRGARRAKGGANSTSVVPTAPGPVHDLPYVLSVWKAMGRRGEPNKKHVENPKGVLSNFINALGEGPVKYNSSKVNVDGHILFRATIVADPNPPPPPQAFGAPSLPQAVQPLVGTGDAPSVKEAEKLAALHACMQLAARDLFTSSNLPTRTGGIQMPSYAASTGKGAAEPSNGGAPQASLPAFKTVASGASPDNNGKTIGLSSGIIIGLEDARGFMDYYCQRFGFGRPDLQYATLSAPSQNRRRGGGQGSESWRATLLVNGRRIGVGEAKAKKDATNRAYLDVAQYLESCDPDLWNTWMDKKRSNLVAKGHIAAHVRFEADAVTAEELTETVYEARESALYTRARAMIVKEKEKRLEELQRRRRAAAGMDVDLDASADDAAAGSSASATRRAEMRAPMLKAKSDDLKARLRAYQTESRVEKLREQRESLPVSSHASSVLAKIATASVTVVLAATGSGKTTQIPQLILDDWILRGDGAKCNIVCTQPRRIAAISVAERVAKERGEALGDSVGYQVRFESKPPRPDGSILFCTTGLFLRRMQADLHNTSGEGFLDGVTHVCVDEVHERDVDTDLLLFVLRMLLHQRREAGKAEIRVVLMSATIDPKLFTGYFADEKTGRLAPVVEIPGRSFPVEQHWLDETVEELKSLRLAPQEGAWVWNEKSVQAYLQRELVSRIGIDTRTGRTIGEIDDLDMPYPLIALMIANALAKSEEGHVLVFLPGWDEIKAVQNILMEPNRFPLLGINFNDSRKYELHVLHSSVPIAEQQAVFDPPPPGVRRIVLSTNIAETSVTIPDVVYVVDSAKCKEKRYDPERRLSQLVSAWTGTSNLFQRAGRAGRHRPGEYYSIVSNARREVMDIHQTVEMLRTDLANTCMHITGLQLPDLSVEDVLSATIQPPEQARVHAAMDSLHMVGAIDRDEKLTSLGRVLLQLPVEAAIGKLCLLGSFFRCLEPALTLAAISTNRDPFMAPIAVKEMADLRKNEWTPKDFRSDPLTVLRAYDAWDDILSRQGMGRARDFARDNFLSFPTLQLIQKIKQHLLQSLDKAGVLGVSAGGQAVRAPAGRNFRRGRDAIIPPSLNVNAHSLPLLSALIATAMAPNFAIRTGEKTLRTSQDKTCAIHPSSVNSRKNEKVAEQELDVAIREIVSSDQLYAFGEKSKTGGLSSNSGGQMFLRQTTMLDPLGYMLFGAYDLKVTDHGLECDNWLPIVGNVSALDDVERLKEVLDLSLLRVFEGLGVQIGRTRQQHATRPTSGAAPNARDEDHDDEESEGEAEQEAVDMEDPTLSAAEVSDLDRLTSQVVKILNHFTDARLANTSSSRGASRPETPSQGYPSSNYGSTSKRNLSSLPATRNATPRDSPYNSRPGSSHGYQSGGGATVGGSGGLGRGAGAYVPPHAQGSGGGWGAAGGGTGTERDWRSR